MTKHIFAKWAFSINKSSLKGCSANPLLRLHTLTVI